MLDESTAAIAPASVLAHYEAVADRIGAHFSGTPLIALFEPDKDDGPIVRVGRLHHPIPEHIPKIAVTTRSGSHAYVALTPQSLLWRVHQGAVGFESWTPTAADPLAVRFARLILSARGKATFAMLRTAAHAARSILQNAGLDAVPVLDDRSVALFVPFDDAPGYEAVRGWLHDVMAEAQRREPALFEIAHLVPPDRIHISAQSDAPGHGSALPYSLRPGGFALVTPCTWAEFESISTIAWTIENARERLAIGDVFAAEIARIGAQRFATLDTPVPTHPTAAPVRATTSPEPTDPYAMQDVFELQPRSDVITVAFDILADGKPRSVDEILAEAVARDLLPRDERKKYVYATLKGYVEKMIARGLRPVIVQDPDRRFRSNHPADDLPDPTPDRPYAPPTDTIAQLTAAAAGTDPTAFEVAVCAAFAPLGFAAHHIGGNANPDGTMDAILGVLGYRVMLECKLNTTPLVRPDIAEAAKYRDQYGAQHAIMVANAYAAERETLDECETHRVSLWTTDDLLRVLTLGIDAYELRTLFAPGLAANALTDVEWSRAHGARKRLAVICDALLEAGWAAQVIAADYSAPADAPLLTEDAAIMLVDEYVASHGSHTACTRDDIRQAFDYLTSPRVAKAVWADDRRSAIIVVERPLHR